MQRTFVEPAERFPHEQLGFQIKELFQDELLQFLDSERKKSMDTTTNNQMETEGQKVHFPGREGAEVAEPLAFGRMKSVWRFPLHDNLSPVMIAGRKFISDVVVWKEALPFVAIVWNLTVNKKKSLLYRRPERYTQSLLNMYILIYNSYIFINTQMMK